MRLVTFVKDGEARPGLLEGETVLDISSDSAWAEPLNCVPTTVLDLLRTEVDPLSLNFSGCKRTYPLNDIELRAPIERPGKLLALAGNYADHLKESGHEWAEKILTTPRVFMKPQTSVTGPNSEIIYPPNAGNIDWECELAVVMGRTARFVNAADGLDYVAGYTVMNDVSERSLVHGVDRDSRDGDKWFDWLNGKWFDTFAPMGPSLVLKDEIPDPHVLDIRLWVNGEEKQSANTGQMIFAVAELVEWVSRFMTLEPGDIISTGTAAGVGSASGTYLSPGDLVEAEIPPIGRLINAVTAYQGV